MIPTHSRLGARLRLGASALAVVATLAIAAPPIHAQDPSPPAGAARFADIPRYRVDDHGTNVQPGSVPRTPPSAAWSHQLPDSVAFTPLLAAGRLLVADSSGGIHALDAATGTEAWTADVDATPTGAIVVDDVLVVSVGDAAGSVHGLALDDGTSRWTLQGLGSAGAGALARLDGTAVLASDDGSLHRIDVQTGSATQTWPLPAPAASLAIADATAYVGLLDGRTVAIDLVDGSQPWPPVTLLSNAPSSIAVGETAYYIAARQPPGDPSSELLAVERASGEVLWRFRSPSGRQVGPGSLHDGMVFSGSEGDGLYALDADTGEIAWNAPTAPASAGQAAYADGLILLPGFDETLSAWDAADGSAVWSVPLASGASTSPIASGGLVFQGDDHGMVWAFGPPGAAASPGPAASPVVSLAPASAPLTVVEEWDTTQLKGLAHPCAGDVAADGALVLPSCGSSEVLVVGPTGKVRARTGSKGTKTGQFDFLRDPKDPPSAIGGATVAPDGTIYVVDTVNHRVQHLGADLSVLGSFGSYGQGDGQFLEPIDIAAGPDGTIYVVDDVRDDIQRFAADGTYLQTIGSHGKGPGQLSYTGGIDVGPDGTVLNADWDNQRVQAWTADGEFLWTMGKRGGGPGEFRGPADVLMAADGRIVVADFEGYRLQVFGPDLTWLGDLPIPDLEAGQTVSGLAGGGADGRIYAMRGFTDRILVLQLGTPAVTAATTDATPTPSLVAGCPNPHGGSCLGPLPAGTSTTSTFLTPITYTVPDGWSNLEDLPGNVLLLPPGSSLDGVDAGTEDYIGIFDGVSVASDDCASHAQVGVGRTAADMAAALRSRGGLSVSEPVPVEIGGLSGLMIDIARDASTEGGCLIPELSTTIVPLIIGAGPASVEHAQLDGFTTRLYLLDHGLSNVVIEISDVATSAATTADYLPVIESLVFGD